MKVFLNKLFGNLIGAPKPSLMLDDYKLNLVEWVRESKTKGRRTLF